MTVARAAPFVTITIDRPDRMNALDQAARFAMATAVDDFLADPRYRVAIVTASGSRLFSAGLDLKEPAPADGALPPMPESGFGGLTARTSRKKPVIAAVNGLAAGGGFELVLACDIALCSPDAWFSLPEPEVGLVALAGGLVRLVRAVGERRATEIALTRRRIGAQEALVLGVVTAVVPRAELPEAALSVARSLAAASPRALAATRDVIAASAGLPIEATLAMQTERASVRALLQSADPVEGRRAFSARRPPQWEEWG